MEDKVMEDKEIDVIRCRDCIHATAGTVEGLLVCNVRNGVGGFAVYADGYCDLAKTHNLCSDCMYYSQYVHKLGDEYCSGICTRGARQNEDPECTSIEPAKHDAAACSRFEPIDAGSMPF